LINAQDNSQIWGQQYNRNLAYCRVLWLQSEIAREISDNDGLKTLGGEHHQNSHRLPSAQTDNLKAYPVLILKVVRLQRGARAKIFLNAMGSLTRKGSDLPKMVKLCAAYTDSLDAYAPIRESGSYNGSERWPPQSGRCSTARRLRSIKISPRALFAGSARAKVLFATLRTLPLGQNVNWSTALEISVRAWRWPHAVFWGILIRLVNGQLESQSGRKLESARELDPFSAPPARMPAAQHFPYYRKARLSAVPGKCMQTRESIRTAGQASSGKFQGLSDEAVDTRRRWLNCPERDRTRKVDEGPHF
jgi:hypothetical protein